MATIADVKLRVFCHFCEKKNAVSWKCLCCQDLYCNDCKKVHEKFSISKDHIIVSLVKLNDKIMAEQKLKILSAIKSQGKCDLFCVKCELRINDVEKVEEHVDHQLDQFENFQNVNDINIKSLITKVNVELELPKDRDNQKQNIIEKKEIKKQVQQKYDEIMQSCKNKVKALHNEIDDFYKEKEKSIKESHTQVNKERTKLAIAKDKLCSLEHKNKSIQLQTAYQELKEQWQQYISVLPSHESVLFQSGKQTSVEIATQLGCLSYSRTIARGSVQKHHLQLVDTIQPIKLQTISLMSPCGERQACIGGIKSKTIQLVNVDSPSTPLNEITMTFYDFSTSVDGNLLYISDFKNKSLQTLSKVGILRKVKDFSPMLPTCVHVTLQDEIFVGIVDSDSKNMDSGSRRTILKLTCEGIKKADLEFDSRGVRLFTVPYRCCVNEVTKDIVIIDKHNAFTGRIIGINERGDVKFTYSGTESGTKKKYFLPTDIKCTKTGEIIICDIDNHSLHILDRNGTFLQNMSTLEVKILHPSSLAIDSNDQLWIGTSPPTSGKQNGQIFITSLTIIDVQSELL